MGIARIESKPRIHVKFSTKITTLPDKTWNYGEVKVKVEALGWFVYHLTPLMRSQPWILRKSHQTTEKIKKNRLEQFTRSLPNRWTLKTKTLWSEESEGSCTYSITSVGTASSVKFWIYLEIKIFFLLWVLFLEFVFFFWGKFGWDKD